MQFENNQVVKLRNGKMGVVASFNGRPFQLVFSAFSMPIRRFDENFNNSNHDYDVVEVYDGSSIDNVVNVFKASFTTNGLNLVWERN